MKRQRGITLIALVITIIVLLILAGVSISAITGENGIVPKAKEANVKTSEAEKEEEEMLQDALDYIDSNMSGDTFEVLAVETIVTGNNRTLTGGDPSYKNPIIPVGFKAVNDGASWEISEEEIVGWNDGLVIEDENENQFVWVPVDGVNVPYEKWCTSGNNYAVSNITGDDLPTGIIETNQITKYGGFWIGRYEAGRCDIDSLTEEINNVSAGVEVLIQKGAQPWNFISYTNAKKVSEAYLNNANVKSGLVTGTQWDTIMKWVENAGYNVTTDSTEWGNYYNNTNVLGNGRYSTSEESSVYVWQTGTFSKTGNGTLFIGTGLYEDAKVKNIYDLAGNVYEWTAEKCTDYFITRSGSGSGEGYTSAGYRGYEDGDGPHCELGFRVVLFVM